MSFTKTAAVLLVAAGLIAPVLAADRVQELRGKWTVDKVSAFEAAAPPAYKAATPEKQKEMRDEMLSKIPDMVLEFGDGTVSTKVGTEAGDSATYKVTKSDEKTVWFDVTSKGQDGKPSVDKMIAEFTDADTVKFSRDGDPMALVLKRAK